MSACVLRFSGPGGEGREEFGHSRRGQNWREVRGGGNTRALFHLLLAASHCFNTPTPFFRGNGKGKRGGVKRGGFSLQLPKPLFPSPTK